jgi:hypothetical protein
MRFIVPCKQVPETNAMKMDEVTGVSIGNESIVQAY